MVQPGPGTSGETLPRPPRPAGGGVFVAGHFGEWIQGLAGPDGPVALVTLACPGFGVRARREAGGPLVLDQNPPVLDAGTAARFVASLGAREPGRVRLEADLPPGGGAGMSTAALVALARAAGCPGLSDEALAAACLAAEGATDPLMLGRPDAAIWAPRAARVLAAVAPPPEAEIVGGFFGPPLRTEPADRRFPDVADLLALWPSAAGLPAAAALASRSAERTTALRGPADDPMQGLARRLGALGHARAHTGSARALIFAPGTAPQGAEAALAAAGLTGCLRFRTGGRP